MKKNRRLFLFATLVLLLLSAACGPAVTATPTAFPPTPVPSETDMMEITPTMEVTATHEMPEVTATATGDTPTPTQTGVAPVIPVQLVCWFCVQQVPHALLILPQSATIEVPSSSTGISCNSVETVGDDQIVLCQGPAGTGMVSFDVNVCSNGNCTERQVTAVDCSTQIPTTTTTPTVTGTATGTATAGAATATPAAGTTTTATPAVSVPTMTVTLEVSVVTVTPTP